MDFIELQVICKPEFKDILIAETGELGFDSMIETETGFNAYIEEESFEEHGLSYLENKYGEPAGLKWEIAKVVRKNWNEEWEKNFHPVILDGKCAVRASFHTPISSVPHEIIINPKMSFGTGHHETTSLMVRHQLDIDHRGKKVLDCGCGTGILSILASKLNATSVTGYDIDEWAVENSEGNARLNDIEDIKFLQGKIRSLELPGKYDLVLANINKNILLDEIKEYARYIEKEGLLVLSGFYSEDLQDIRKETTNNKLKFLRSETLNNWVGGVFVKE